jgi:hypothetical protein
MHVGLCTVQQKHTWGLLSLQKFQSMEKSRKQIGATLRYVRVRFLGPWKIPGSQDLASTYVLCPHPRTGCPDFRMGYVGGVARVM